MRKCNCRGAADCPHMEIPTQPLGEVLKLGKETVEIPILYRVWEYDAETNKESVIAVDLPREYAQILIDIAPSHYHRRMEKQPTEPNHLEGKSADFVIVDEFAFPRVETIDWLEMGGKTLSIQVVTGEGWSIVMGHCKEDGKMYLIADKKVE